MTIHFTAHQLSWWYMVIVLFALLIGTVAKRTSYFIMMIVSVCWAIWWEHRGFWAFFILGSISAFIYLYMWMKEFTKQHDADLKQKVGNIQLERYKPPRK